MSFEVSNFYWDQCTDIKGNDRLVIIALAYYCNEQGWCYPSVRELARRCQLSDRGTQKILAKLAAGGHITIEANQGTRKTSGSPTHRYNLLAYQRNLNGDKGEPMRSPLMDEPDTQKGEPMRSPIDTAKGEQIAAKGEPASSPEPMILIEPNTNNATRAQPTARPVTAAAPAAVAQDDYRAVVKVYQTEIGMLTPIIQDGINAQLRQCPVDWVTKAIGIAAMRNNRRWAYVEGILRRWQTEGFDGGMDNLSARTGNAGRAGSKSMGYGRQMTSASSKKGPQTNEYENDPEYLAFLASFNDGTADSAAIAAD
jgi:DnaD/phage-associated family protein